MADTTDTAAALAAMTAERDAATALAAAEKTRADQLAADLADLQNKFAARDRAERESAVKQLLGDEFSADAAKPYMDMTPEQFGAVQAGFAALRSKLPAGFTAEQATGGAGAITPEAIHQYRSANPGASYEQAFAALKAPAARSIPTTFSG